MDDAYPGDGEPAQIEPHQMVDPVATMNSHLESIINILSGHPAQADSILALGAQGQASQAYANRIRVKGIIISATGAGTAILKIGTSSQYTFNVPATMAPVYLPFPYVVENGVDISAAGTAAGLTIYVVYTSE